MKKLRKLKRKFQKNLLATQNLRRILDKMGEVVEHTKEIIGARKIIIVQIRKPQSNNINHELQWLGTSLGLFHLRDKDRSCFRIFIELLKGTKMRHPLSSDEIAVRLKLTRGTVVHHMNRLMESGLVIHERKKYVLREENLEALIDHVRNEVNSWCDELRKTAHEIDEFLGL